MSGSGAGPALVVSAHAGDFVWRAGGAMALAASRGEIFGVKRRVAQLRRDSGPNLGLAHDTMAEAFLRVYPQVTGVLK